MTIIRILDLETTGVDPTDEVVEIAAVDLNLGDETEVKFFASDLVKPSKPIPPQASAIHNIVDADVADCKPWDEVWPAYLDSQINFGNEIDYFAAHNAAFESRWLSDSMRKGRPFICTYKAALRVWPEAPSHSNGALRYWRGLNVDRKIADQSHRAFPDAYVTAYLLNDLLQHAKLTDMLAWTKEPALLPVCPIGKEWRGKPWSAVDTGFLTWMIGQKDMDSDLIWNARFELHKRAGTQQAEQERWVKIKRDAYVEAAPVAIKTARTIADLNLWWKDSQQHFAIHRIEKGDDDYNKLRDACAARKAELMTQEQAA